MRSRTVPLVLVLLVVSTLLAVTPATAASPYLDESFQSGVDVFDGGWGLQSLGDGHVGTGLKTVIPAGQHWGASAHWNFAQHGLREPDELWWRYWIRFPEGFYVEVPNRGKLPGVGGLYTYNCLGGRPSTVDEPCFSARMLFGRTYPKKGEPGYPNGPADQTRLGFYAYHLDSPSNRGDIWPWDLEQGTLDHGRWYCVEGRIRMNTPGQRDGVLQGFVGGQPAFDRRDIAFRRASEGWMHVKSFWFDVYYGGSSSAVRNEIHFDSLAFGPQRVGCDDAFRYDGTFHDDDGSPFETDIEWLAATGITRGCNPPTNDRFCPEGSVTRGQMAAFLTRALGLSRTSGVRFRDVPSDALFAQQIDALATAGITRGCNPPENDRFCPDAPVSREQMAAFLSRALRLPPGDASFTDVPSGSVFRADIAKLAAAGITRGCNPPRNDRYCPRQTVTRGQMAAFLHRALGS